MRGPAPMAPSPNAVDPVGSFKLGRISILPKSVKTHHWEKRCLRARAGGKKASYTRIRG